MAKIRFASHVKEIHGRTGNYIYYCVKGRQYARAYSKPRNPVTGAQQACRTSFAEAVKMWQKLPQTEKDAYNRKSVNKPYSGYNLFMSIHLTCKKTNTGQRGDPSGYIKHLIRGNSVLNPVLYADYSNCIQDYTGGYKKPPGMGCQRPEAAPFFGFSIKNGIFMNL